MDLEYKLYKHAWVYKGALDKEQPLNQEQVNELLSKGGWLVRNVYDFDCKEQTNFWYVLKDQQEPFNEIPKKTQGYIRKANDAFIIGKISKERMLQEGYDVYCKAFDHYKIKDWKLSKEQFEQSITDPNIEIWGCIFKETDRLEAYMICRINDKICEKSSSKTNPAYLPKYYPMYGLNYAIHQYYLEEKKVNYIISGTRSATHHSNIQEFLIEKFNYRKAYCHLTIHYKWWLGLMVKVLYPFRNRMPNNSIKALLIMHGMQG